MKFAVITHVEHKKEKEHYLAYAPYVREMNLWYKYVDTIEIVAPLIIGQKSKIDLEYKHPKINFNSIPSIQFTSISKSFLSLLKLPVILFKIFRVCVIADHIHLRCPGNIGLLGCFVQIFFPRKIKTAKYAGNWDPNAKQPLSYKFQKWLLSNTFLTKNMQVLVYGKWEKQSKNVKPFFTATYSKNEIETIACEGKFSLKNNPVKFLFVGTLSRGKRSLLSAEVILNLVNEGYNVHLDIYGEGESYKKLSQFIKSNHLNKYITLHGNVPKEEIKEAYKNAGFLLLLSKSEGWPKVVAEAMFWGCLPISTAVSCVPYMLGRGSRGAIVNDNVDEICLVIKDYLSNNEKYHNHVSNAVEWSRKYTIERFDNEINNLIKG